MTTPATRDGLSRVTDQAATTGTKRARRLSALGSGHLADPSDPADGSERKPAVAAIHVEQTRVTYLAGRADRTGLNGRRR